MYFTISKTAASTVWLVWWMDGGGGFVKLERRSGLFKNIVRYSRKAQRRYFSGNSGSQKNWGLSDKNRTLLKDYSLQIF